ncbi:MAG: hypothetical protein ACI4N3_01990 [Alphaproteobacteria bacterium]
MSGFVNASIKNNYIKKSNSVVENKSLKKEKNVKLPQCPVGIVLNRFLDKNLGKVVFYMRNKVRCDLPDNVGVRKWNKSNVPFYPLSLKVLPSWIPEAQAFYLVCSSGYVEKTVNNLKTCVNVSEVCPLNEIIEKSGNDYIHPFTNEVCVEPENAMIRNVWGTENTRSSTLADRNAYLFECPPNYYSAVYDIHSSLRISCEECPDGMVSPRGAKSQSECVRSCLSGEVRVLLSDGSVACKVCDADGAVYDADTKSCKAKDGYQCNADGTVCSQKNILDKFKDIIAIAVSVVVGLFMGSGKKLFSKLSTIFEFISNMKE